MTLFATAPILLYTVRLVILYISYASIADISSYIPQMLALIFTILFWLYFAYCCGGVGSRKKLIRYGILCVGLTLIHTLSSLLIHLLAAEQPLTFPFLAWLGADLCVCAYVLCFLLTRVPNMVPALSAQHADAAKAGESE